MRFWLSFPRLLLICITMLLIWGSLLWFWYDKAEEVSNHPCNVCAARQGEDVICTLGKTKILSRIYYPNYTYEDIDYANFSGT